MKYRFQTNIVNKAIPHGEKRIVLEELFREVLEQALKMDTGEYWGEWSVGIEFNNEGNKSNG